MFHRNNEKILPYYVNSFQFNQICKQAAGVTATNSSVIFVRGRYFKRRSVAASGCTEAAAAAAAGRAFPQAPPACEWIRSYRRPGDGADSIEADANEFLSTVAGRRLYG